MTTVTPFLWFDNDLREVIDFYRTAFPDLEVDGVPPGDGPVVSASVRVGGQRLHLLNGGPVHAGFTEAISLMTTVETQDELDRLWDRLTDGGEPVRCGWLRDRFGLSWQVVPTVLGTLLSDPDRTAAERVHAAMLGMVKLDIAALQAAAVPRA